MAAIGFLACSSGPSYVAPPMSAQAGSPEAAPIDRGELAATARTAFRPLPAEPTPPAHATGCKRIAVCQPEEDEPPALAYPPPFERCWPQVDRGARALSFSPKETRDARVEDAHACCYVEFTECARRPPVVGRPLYDEDGRPRRARSRRRRDWSDDAGGYSAPSARTWTRDAANEHASIGSFAILTLDLLALGAPPDLVRDAQRAALDEIAHARICYGIAASARGHAVGPASLPVPRRIQPSSFEALARETFRDGCVNEARAAVDARKRRRPREVWARIAEDEERHAELAWRIVRWALAADPAVARALREEAARLDPRDALVREVVRPCLDALLSGGAA